MTSVQTGIHRKLLYAASYHLLVFLIGAIIGGTAFGTCIYALQFTHFYPHYLLLGLIIGFGVLVYCISMLTRSLGWLHRASWVFRNVEPDPMRLTIMRIPSCRFGHSMHRLVSLTPMNEASHGTANPALHIVYARHHHKRRSHHGHKNIFVLVYADFHHNGPIVIRLKDRLLYTNIDPFATFWCQRKWRKYQASHEKRSSSSSMVEGF